MEVRVVLGSPEMTGQPDLNAINIPLQQPERGILLAAAAMAGIVPLGYHTHSGLEVVMRTNLSSRGTAGSAIAILAALTVGACASGHTHANDNHVARTVIHLSNDLTPPADVTVYAIGQGGLRLLLGDLPPNGHKVLRLPGAIQPGTTYHIVAERNGGRAVVSQPITASNDDMMIDLDLQTNSMWFPSDNGS